MGLHQSLNAPKPEPRRFESADVDEEEREDGACPECGTTSWGNYGYGRYSQNMYYTFGQSRYVEYDNLDTEGIDESDGWQCENGHSATDDVQEVLDQLA